MGVLLYFVWKCPKCGHHRPAPVDNLYVVCPKCGYMIYDRNRKHNPAPVHGPVHETDARRVATVLNDGGRIDEIRIPKQLELSTFMH